MNPVSEIVFIIDDDKSVRNALSLFLSAGGYQVEAFESSEEYLEREAFEGTGCIILDVNLGGKSGPELQEDLIAAGSHLPIIFITGRANIHQSVSAVKKGAVNFLEKPFQDDELLQAVSEALNISRVLKEDKEEVSIAHKLIASLTPRENEILRYLLTGMLSKQIADQLGIAEQTVKLHRRSISLKLGVRSVAEIIRIANKAGIIPFGKMS